MDPRQVYPKVILDGRPHYIVGGRLIDSKKMKKFLGSVLSKFGTQMIDKLVSKGAEFAVNQIVSKGLPMLINAVSGSGLASGGDLEISQQGELVKGPIRLPGKIKLDDQIIHSVQKNELPVKIERRKVTTGRGLKLLKDNTRMMLERLAD